MNILVIGNGFDLAHGLPTKYEDFFNFCIKIRDILDNAYNKNSIWFNEENLFAWKRDDEVKELLKNIYKTTLRIMDYRKQIYTVELRKKYNWVSELYILIKDNIWIDYFESNKKNQKENWADFENEIRNLIKQIDNDMFILDGKRHKIDDKIHKLSNSFLTNRYNIPLQSINLEGMQRERCYRKVSFKQIRDDLKTDLDKLIRALEIYLINVVSSLEIKICIPELFDFEPDYILSFNYTDTYEKVYGKKSEIVIDHIHGRAQLESTINTNNMVLGIDEYLEEDMKNSNLDFLKFKKFYQKINKQIDCKYKKYLKKDEKHRIIILGHSLDIIDKEVIKDLLLTKNAYITILYFNQSDKEKKIENIIKIIGKDELVSKTSGNIQTLELKQQSDTKNLRQMMVINSIKKMTNEVAMNIPEIIRGLDF